MKSLAILPALLLLIVLTGLTLYQNPGDMKSSNPIATDNDSGNYKIQRSELEWKEMLEPQQFEILRRSGTERPFTGIYYDNKKPGVYFSAATGQPLFSSDSKFDSGCGWPSFFEPIAEGSILYRTDRSHGMIRTEIIDSSSGSHLGHVFDDGPPPTGLRYCMNSAAMIFVGTGEELPPLTREYMDKFASGDEKNRVSELLGY